MFKSNRSTPRYLLNLIFSMGIKSDKHEITLLGVISCRFSFRIMHLLTANMSGMSYFHSILNTPYKTRVIGMGHIIFQNNLRGIIKIGILFLRIEFLRRLQINKCYDMRVWIP